MIDQKDDGFKDDIQTELLKSGFKTGVRNGFQSLITKTDKQTEVLEKLATKIDLLSIEVIKLRTNSEKKI